MIFNESTFHCGEGPAKLVAFGTGYGSFLHGKVVDMLFFPVWKNQLGEVQFFQPVFNIADSAISIGVASILLFQRHYFNDDKKVEPTTNETETPIVDEEIIENDADNGVDTEGAVLDTEEVTTNDVLPDKDKNDAEPDKA